ncbi:SDR family NAD(P)-dependent oxidoreductase [Nitrosomonas marina]|uniref:NAD(P)-dependent dehydrogenase, short-chain alcohol dehydrogenase family n=1 Tax=Nitrosomonas marina TaxID=917 RepID=A0A1H8DV96_9PROT|nr:SDR family NAD(P)-dependent oxidoreductase [Nitrosomonas marina]SEN11221.1 NAD(P)-dependent dehydrogenase, short-chain alcohol dehydrogenase family [Nitrosomonas marina]
MYTKIAIIGSSGAIGSSFVKLLTRLYPQAEIHTFSRKAVADRPKNFKHHIIDYSDEQTIESAAKSAYENMPFDLVIVATGILYGGADIQPEKCLRDLSADKFRAIFNANTIFPALAAKYFLPLLNKDKRSVFAALSARVGSISDNQLGGWYAYRASKAALNMIIKNAAIEMGRRYKHAIIVGLHPGTVDSNLSKPFQSRVPEGKLFTPDFAVEKLVSVIENLSAQNSGKCFGWDGQEILP